MTCRVWMVLFTVLLSSCTVQKTSDTDKFKGASIARICRDGHYVWHLSDGSYADSFDNPVEDINTVCGS